ncbi:MAG TPA: cytochrome C oxidase subunit II [Nitrolancea sp.]
MEERTSTWLAPRGIWWHRFGRDEKMWLAVIIVWAVAMFVMIMFIWPAIGQQQADIQSYRVDPVEFSTLTAQFTEKYKVGEENGFPVVAPPPGSDVYLQASRFQWTPILKLQKGETYRFLISSLDVEHGFSLQPDNVNFQILPGYITGLKMTPHETGEFTVVCNEFCGLGHHVMVGRIIVTDDDN